MIPEIIAGWEPLSGVEWILICGLFLSFLGVIFLIALLGLNFLYRLAKWVEGTPQKQTRKSTNSGCARP